MSRLLHSHPYRVASVVALLLVGAVAFLHAAESTLWNTGAKWPEPRFVKPGDAPGQPPSDAIVLFNGKDFSAWTGSENWSIRDGYAICGGKDLITKQSFGDCQLHVEWQIPPEVVGENQRRGNSGIFLMSQYEVQVLDSSAGHTTYFDGQAGSIYKQRPPMVNVCRKSSEWQTYDIIFRAPHFDAAGKLLKPAFITVLQNGVLVQDHFEIMGHTNGKVPPRYDSIPPRQPLRIQFHRNGVYYRNIWIRDLEEDHEELLAPFRARLKAGAVH